MSKKPTLGGAVQISEKRFTVLIEPKRFGGSFRILVLNNETGGSYWAQSEGWRGGCGPWKIMSPQPSLTDVRPGDAASACPNESFLQFSLNPSPPKSNQSEV